MGRVAELVRWTCDACGADGDGIGDLPPESWTGLSRENGEYPLVFCPACEVGLRSVCEARFDAYMRARKDAQALMCGPVPPGNHSTAATLMLLLWGAPIRTRQRLGDREVSMVIPE